MSNKAANVATAAGARPPETHSLKQRAASEIRRYFVLFLYLWLLFAMFSLNQRIVLREHGLSFTSQGFAFVNALVLAKVMLLFETFDPGRWLRRRPLIYPILFEAFLLTILFFIAHVLEEDIKGLFRGEAVHEGLPSIGGGGLVGLLERRGHHIRGAHSLLRLQKPGARPRRGSAALARVRVSWREPRNVRALTRSGPGSLIYQGARLPCDRPHRVSRG